MPAAKGQEPGKHKSCGSWLSSSCWRQMCWLQNSFPDQQCVYNVYYVSLGCWSSCSDVLHFQVMPPNQWTCKPVICTTAYLLCKNATAEVSLYPPNVASVVWRTLWSDSCYGSGNNLPEAHKNSSLDLQPMIKHHDFSPEDHNKAWYLEM